MDKLLILSDQKEFKKDLGQKINSMAPGLVDITTVSSRGNALFELAQKEFKVIVIDCSLAQQDLELVLKYLSTNDYYFSHIFFLSENFAVFDEVIKALQFPHLNLISLPIENQKLAEQIVNKIQTKDHTVIDSNLKINLEFLKVFVDSIKRVLNEFCMLNEISHGRPFLKKAVFPIEYALIGEINLKSEVFDGIFRLGFTKSFYLDLINKVIQVDATEINDEILDFAGELVNMTYGQAKVILNENGHNFLKVIPRYEVVENKLPLRHHTIVVPINTELGELYVEIEVITIQGYKL